MQQIGLELYLIYYNSPILYETFILQCNIFVRKCLGLSYSAYKKTFILYIWSNDNVSNFWQFSVFEKIGRELQLGPEVKYFLLFPTLSYKVKNVLIIKKIK